MLGNSVDAMADGARGVAKYYMFLFKFLSVIYVETTHSLTYLFCSLVLLN